MDAWHGVHRLTDAKNAYVSVDIAGLWSEGFGLNMACQTCFCLKEKSYQLPHEFVALFSYKKTMADAFWRPPTPNQTSPEAY